MLSPFHTVPESRKERWDLWPQRDDSLERLPTHKQAIPTQNEQHQEERKTELWEYPGLFSNPDLRDKNDFSKEIPI